MVDMNKLGMLFGIDVAIKKLRPTAAFTVYNSEITEWKDPSGLPQPTWDEIMEVYNKDIEEFNSMEYARQRFGCYPAWQDQLDLLWHDIDSGKFGTKESSWYQTIKEIKDKFPK